MRAEDFHKAGRMSRLVELSLHWTQKPSRWFCHAEAQINFTDASSDIIYPTKNKGYLYDNKIWFGLVWLLFNVLVNNFSVMLGRSHLGIYQYFLRA